MSNGKLLSLKLDVTKIPKDRIFKGKKGAYIDVDVWINEDADEYGNHASANIQQSKEERENKERKIYIGNGKKVFGWDDEQAPTSKPAAPVNDDEEGDLPF